MITCWQRLPCLIQLKKQSFHYLHWPGLVDLCQALRLGADGWSPGLKNQYAPYRKRRNRKKEADGGKFVNAQNFLLEQGKMFAIVLQQYWKVPVFHHTCAPTQNRHQNPICTYMYACQYIDWLVKLRVGFPYKFRLYSSQHFAMPLLLFIDGAANWSWKIMTSLWC